MLVSSRSSRKRLRVRLKANDRESLAESFGPSLSQSGMFLRSKELLPEGTKVLVELFYNQGELAIRGKGVVKHVHHRGSEHDGMSMDLDWSEGTKSTVEWVLKRVQEEEERPVSDQDGREIFESGESDDPFEAVTVLAADSMTFLSAFSTSQEDLQTGGRRFTLRGARSDARRARGARDRVG